MLLETVNDDDVVGRLGLPQSISNANHEARNIICRPTDIQSVNSVSQPQID